MKKFIMIIVAAGFVNFVSAKPGEQKDFGSVKNKFEKREKDRKNNDDIKYNLKERDEKVRQSDWFYEQKIRDVKNSRRLNAAQKYRQVYLMQKQREAVQKRIENDYDRSSNGRYNDHQSKW